MSEQCILTLPPLPYPYNALEPCISSQTLKLHHDKLMAKSLDTLCAELACYPQYQCWSVDRLLWECHCLPVYLHTPVRRNAGSVYAHELYFDGMTPSPAKAEPCGPLMQAIERCFGCMEHFWDIFFKTANSHFGDGWVWLASDKCGKLTICATNGHDTPLAQHMRPILNVDLWEHAYYLDYHTRRDDYLKAWKSLIDWDFAEANYQPCT